MAEREGFEPSMGFKAHTPLAGERLRPLGHLSIFDLMFNYISKQLGQQHLIDAIDNIAVLKIRSVGYRRIERR